jgi:hypothetical protein
VILPTSNVSPPNRMISPEGMTAFNAFWRAACARDLANADGAGRQNFLGALMSPFGLTAPRSRRAGPRNDDFAEWSAREML